MSAIASIGMRIRARRTDLDRSVQDVATAADLSVPYISNLENGRGNPTLNALTTIAKALRIPLHELVRDDVTEAALEAKLSLVYRQLRSIESRVADVALDVEGATREIVKLSESFPKDT
jgi:transcriptional regulator with XRE-family HTH domain